MSSLPKQLVLIEAYEELTDKESFCLKEGNIEGCLKVQGKKAKLLPELQLLKGASMSTELRATYQERLNRLQEIEQNNAAVLSQLIEKNRNEHKKLSKQSGSASKFRKAYANPTEKRTSSVSLEGQA